MKNHTWQKTSIIEKEADIFAMNLILADGEILSDEDCERDYGITCKMFLNYYSFI
jgi:Zn-dependent peptidase ImmA (M78 family)